MSTSSDLMREDKLVAATPIWWNKVPLQWIDCTYITTIRAPLPLKCLWFCIVYRRQEKLKIWTWHSECCWGNDGRENRNLVFSGFTCVFLISTTLLNIFFSFQMEFWILSDEEILWMFSHEFSWNVIDIKV